MSCRWPDHCLRTCKEHDLVCVAALDERLHGLEPVAGLRVLLAGQVVQPLVLGGLQVNTNKQCTAHASSTNADSGASGRAPDSILRNRQGQVHA